MKCIESARIFIAPMSEGTFYLGESRYFGFRQIFVIIYERRELVGIRNTQWKYMKITHHSHSLKITISKFHADKMSIKTFE